MKLTSFFFLILLCGMFLIQENAYLEKSPTLMVGVVLVLLSLFVLPFSIAQQIKEAFNLTYRQKNFFVVGVVVSLITILVMINKYFLEYQAFKLENSNESALVKVDSVKYEKRGKLAPNLYFYYSYEVNGEQYSFSEENREGLGVGQKISIKYDPNNPSNHKVLEARKE